ncbi:hypothetical protein ACFZBU_41975 [Embleya sp. NPDC008237]|uniref:hypothetical protein n=1 Tax=Embleya sp. NPDC008237 TaxID=3363978 RepID=UPI0036E8C9C9
MTPSIRHALRFLAGPNPTLVVAGIALALPAISFDPDATPTARARDLIGVVLAGCIVILQLVRPAAAEALRTRPTDKATPLTPLVAATLASGATFASALAAVIAAHENLRTAPTATNDRELLILWSRQHATIAQARRATEAHDRNLRQLRIDHEIGNIPINHRSLLRRLTDSHDNGLRNLGHTRRFYDTPWQGPRSRDSESP